MQPTSYQFPLKQTEDEKEIPVWMVFYAKPWSTFNSNRTRRAVINDNTRIEVRLPFPKQMATMNSQNYVAGKALNVQSVETGSLVGTIAQQVLATRELFNSFMSGGSVVRADHFETVLEPGARRTHLFEFNLVAKNEAQANMMNYISLIFQNGVFPIANTQSLLTMQHPYIWYFQAFKGIGGVGDFYPIYWDGEPLVSVLKSVDINRAPILNTPFVTPDYKPVALNMKLNFVELEPAMQSGELVGGVGSAKMVSRAERFIQGGSDIGRNYPSRPGV
jgi:hypothetical protein